jgi:putative nucleotidyltransferase with HDIG domain
VTTPLRVYIVGLVVIALTALVATSLVVSPVINPRIAIELDGRVGASVVEVLTGLGFWILATLFASALPVPIVGGVRVAVSTAPLMAATVLGGPVAGGIVAALGTTDSREVRGQVAWYGTLANHSAIVLPVVIAGLIINSLAGPSAGPLRELAATLIGSLAYFACNLALVSLVVALRQGGGIRGFLTSAETVNSWANFFAVAPLGWLMATTFAMTGGGWWTALLYAVPLFTTRTAYQRFIEMREMFTQTIGALAAAVDARDPYTANHSLRVKDISVDIGRQMRVSARELEALEWGGLLHDVGKIGVRDDVLLKPGKLTKEERQSMNSHPVKGAEIIGKVERLAPELPVIRHHHEWYNGSGYPDRLMGDEIPRLARILHVADAFEAMTSDRPYRKGLPIDVAVSELRKFSGIQFDPDVVEAFMQTSWAEGAADPARPSSGPTISFLGDHAKRHNEPAPGSPAADLV